MLNFPESGKQCLHPVQEAVSQTEICVLPTLQKCFGADSLNTYQELAGLVGFHLESVRVLKTCSDVFG